MTNLVITGSHHTPAEALIEQLPEGWRVHRLGSSHSPKFKRYDWWGSLWGLVKLPGLILQAKSSLQLIKADIVVSFGGYSSVPVVISAKLLKLPLVIHEQTFGAGLAVKLTAHLADKIAVSWKSSRQHFPKSKTVLTGNPIRKVFLNLKRLPRPVVYVTGGSQGSLVINQALKPILPQLLERFTVYHQFGRKRPPEFKDKRYISQRYFSAKALAQIYSRAQVVVGRAGINTVTELGYLKIPAVLIPLPYTQRQEQETNARYLHKLGLAVVLPQKQLTPAGLLEAIFRAQSLPRTRSGAGFPRARVKNAAKRLFQLCLNLLSF